MSLILPGHRPTTQLNVTTLHGRVVIQLDRVANEIVLSPADAAQLAQALANAARDLIQHNTAPRILDQ